MDAVAKMHPLLSMDVPEQEELYRAYRECCKMLESDIDKVCEEYANRSAQERYDNAIFQRNENKLDFIATLELAAGLTKNK